MTSRSRAATSSSNLACGWATGVGWTLGGGLGKVGGVGCGVVFSVAGADGADGAVLPFRPRFMDSITRFLRSARVSGIGMGDGEGWSSTLSAEGGSAIGASGSRGGVPIAAGSANAALGP